jgi:hypothetical protein
VCQKARKLLRFHSPDETAGPAYRQQAFPWGADRIEAQFTALRYFALDGTDHSSHREQASMIRRYIIWRNNHACDQRRRRIVDQANVA